MFTQGLVWIAWCLVVSTMATPTPPKPQSWMAIDPIPVSKAEGVALNSKDLNARMAQGGTPSFAPTIFDELIDANIVIAPPWGMPEGFPGGSDDSSDDSQGIVPSPGSAPVSPGTPNLGLGMPANMPVTSISPSVNPAMPNLAFPVTEPPAMNVPPPPMDLSAWARQLELLAMIMREL
ncbi:hypothetical protein BKA66DRAFT_50358 [Pyrenochaeta sp. MPI-SDFR-AT-0127]|nr:hypothetical protein BKA66DRAFT_50358 [Pyrenochaeta sp. MPI-SDFR-AT-0127]